MHFEYQRQNQESNSAVDLDLVVRNRGGGVPCVGRNGLMVDPTPHTAAAASGGTATITGTDHQHQMRLLVLRERLRRALFN